METRTGTGYYMAPEVLEQNYSEKCDYWSLGVILYMMLSGYPPFDGVTEDEILMGVKSMEYDFDDEAWYSISDEAKDLVSNLLIPEAK